MDQISPDEFDEQASSDGESVTNEPGLKQEQGEGLLHTSPAGAAGASGKNASKPAGHLQKRRRVTRACDECRRKKIKCDGKQPCTHCTVYSYECTFDQPSNRRRNPAPQYVESLEHRVHRAESLLHILIPNLDLNDPGIDVAVEQGWIPGAPGKGNPSAAQQSSATLGQDTSTTRRGKNDKSDTNLESMVRAIAQMDVDEQGHWDYHGHSSGLSFVRRMREQLGDLMGPDTKSTPFVKTLPMNQILDSPKSFVESPGGESSQSASELPPRDLAKQLCSNAVEDAAALLRFVHKPSFWKSFDSVYNTPPEHYTNEDSKFLPVLYSAMALGNMFGKDEQSSLNRQGYESAIQQGFMHFKAARQLMDIADCRDLASIQAVIFMILFMQSSAKLSQCYAYVGVALRSALRMGLHRAYAGNFNPIEVETRKRVFWVVRKLDIYVGAMLGLPQTLSDDDIDQDFPAEVDDEYITKDGFLPMPEGHVATLAAFNAHTRLVQLLSKIVRNVYPIKVQTRQGAQDKSYSVPFSAVREIESDLEAWKNSLPPIFSPCDAPAPYIRIQQLLRLAYAHAQIMLYRPFLHFTAMDKRSKPVDQRAYACGASYVNVARNIVHITAQMKQKGLLNGAFWFIMYTTFFSILSLVYFAAENPDNPTTQEVMKDALEGRQVLASLSTRSMAADRCTATLNTVFSRLPDWMREGQQNPVITKKRHLTESSRVKAQTQPLKTPASRSHPEVQNVGRSTPSGTGSIGRASTFPKHEPQRLSVTATGSPPSSFVSPWSGAGTQAFGAQTSPSTGFDSNAFNQFGNSNASSTGSLNMAQYSMPPDFNNLELPDLSAIMFPTAEEPFNYPNQPLTTFENNQQFAKNHPYMNTRQLGSIGNANSMMAPQSRAREDNLEAQFFALPPYIEQRQRQTAFPDDNVRFNNNQDSTSNPFQMNGGWVNDPSMQQDLSNINIQDIFGGAEWNPMLMNPSFQPQ